MSESQFTQEELDEFTAKLDDWGGTLPDRERRLLHALLAEASEFAESQESEVAGFGFDFAGPAKMPSTGTGGELPTLDVLAGAALRPVLQLQDPVRLRAYDRWDPMY